MYSGTVLVVEDDVTVAKLLMTLMANWGFPAIHATTCREATEIATGQPDGIALVICDVRLRHECGAEVVAKLRAIQPEIRALFTSGATIDYLCDSGFLTPEMFEGANTAFLQKPFLPVKLRRAMDMILTAPIASGEPQREVLYASAAY